MISFNYINGIKCSSIFEQFFSFHLYFSNKAESNISQTKDYYPYRCHTFNVCQFLFFFFCYFVVDSIRKIKHDTYLQLQPYVYKKKYIYFLEKREKISENFTTKELKILKMKIKEKKTLKELLFYVGFQCKAFRLFGKWKISSNVKSLDLGHFILKLYFSYGLYKYFSLFFST